MNSSICDWAEPPLSDMFISSSPALAFMVTWTLTTAGVTLAASSEKSCVASPAPAGGAVSKGTMSAGAVQGRGQREERRISGILSWSLGGSPLGVHGIWVPPHGAPMAATLNVCIVQTVVPTGAEEAEMEGPVFRACKRVYFCWKLHASPRRLHPCQQDRPCALHRRDDGFATQARRTPARRIDTHCQLQNRQAHLRRILRHRAGCDRPGEAAQEMATRTRRSPSSIDQIPNGEI